MPLADSTLVCIIRGPSVELKRVDAGVRWCFGCRQHLAHIDILYCDEEPGYYDPIWVRKCSRCGQDRTAFGS